jgi:benzodiazapine receptor
LKIQWKNLITCLAIPLAVGGLSSLLTQNSMETFTVLNKPSLSPPGWLFPVVWTILYIFMGIASYLVLTADKSSETALTLYGVQLIFNFFWSIIFFNLNLYLFAFIWLILLWLLILGTMLAFYQISKPAAYLMLPYLLWVTFAGYLNYSIYLLN